MVGDPAYRPGITPKEHYMTSTRRAALAAVVASVGLSAGAIGTTLASSAGAETTPTTATHGTVHSPEHEATESAAREAAEKADKTVHVRGSHTTGVHHGTRKAHHTDRAEAGETAGRSAR